jgi:flavin reductase (NADH)
MTENRRKTMFLNAMSRWPAGVTIVTAPEEGNFRAATVSSFTSLSADPPQVLVALKLGSRVLELAKDTGVFFVSVLAEDQEEVSNSCARFDSDALTTPHVPGAIAAFACSFEEVLQATHGTHGIMVGQVDTCTPDVSKRPLLYWNRDYCRIR